MTVVVLGGTGYVGRQLLAHLAALTPAVPVRALVRPDAATRRRQLVAPPPDSQVRRYPGRLPDDLPRGLFPDEPHVVVHLAVKQIDDDGTGFGAVNLEGTRRLLARLPPTCRGVIYGSSMSVYGQGAQEAITEEAPLAPGTPLARSRCAAEAVILDACAAAGRGAVILRPRFIIGPGDRFTLPGLLRLVRRRVLVGSGRQAFSVIDVRDYAQIIATLALGLRELVGTRQVPLNVGYRRPVTLAELCQALAAAFRLPPPRWRIPVPDATLRLLQLAGLSRVATPLELITRSHHGDVSALERLVGNAIVGRDALTAVAEAAAALRDVTTPAGGQPETSR